MAKLMKKTTRVAKRRTPLYKGVHQFVGKIKHSVIPIRNTIHLRTSSGDSGYSLEAGSFVFIKDLYQFIRGTNEFIHDSSIYAYMRIKGFTLDFISSVNGQTISTTPQYNFVLPELYLDTTGDVFTGTGGFSSATLCNSDSVMRIQPNNTVKLTTPKYYRFPKILVGGSNYTLGGYDAWIPTSGFAVDTSYAFYLLVGFHNFTFPALSVDGSFPVGKCEMKFYIDFAKKLPLSAGPVS